ncbi:MAG TPA: penicillin acylase family protein [Gemmatimonadaceae bacterium]|jgi:penicillin amidase|nr:penicillin acylase family protein [Gemmatimonadaceae bacterium]
MPARTSPVTVTLAAVVLAAALYVGFVPIRSAPALGAFLDPVHGVWAVATRADLPETQSAKIPGLHAAVDVRYDDRGVPHVFATNLDDAYRAIGWIHARDRLFEMEIQTRAVAGTLTELVGKRALALDREARAMGLAWGAERTFRMTDSNSTSGRGVRAYAQGVNAYIDNMTPADLPLEYRLLSAKPMRWKPQYSAYLLSRMGLTLAYSDGELRRAKVEALIGKAATDALFPANSPIQEPIQPNGQRAARFDFVKLPPPAPADSGKLAVANDLERAAARFASATGGDAEFALGSNSWAVSPRRTAAGHALLEGDPHLTLSMPSVWYEEHIVVPDTLDAYGVGFVGAPFIAIGFNRDVAWTETNTAADVADYYIETVDDDAHPAKYKLDGEWKPLEVRIESVHDRGGAALSTDTIYHTHRGPMLRAGKQWVSRRWTVLEPNDVNAVFARAAMAHSSAELFKAFDSYEAPAQNVLTADRGGHIAIRSTGHYPVRPKSAPRGDVLIDGGSSANDWQGWWPLADYPQAVDPAQGYLASNNQQPKDPKVDPRYFGWDWPDPWRAMRINVLLRSDTAMTPDKMRQFQTDPVSERTKIFVSAFQVAVQAAPAPRDTMLAHAAKLLVDWNQKFTIDNQVAVLYVAALDELTRRTWDELNIPGATSADRPRGAATPSATVLTELLSEPNSPWWDDRSTKDVVEDRDMILRASLLAAYQRTIKQYGQPGEAWRWGYARYANINHLLRIPALSRLNIPMQSGPGTLSPSGGDGTAGSSWRMVVELGPEVRAWGTYPGGQSGNPASKRYDDRLPKWESGQLDTLRFPHRAADLAGHTLQSTLTLTPERQP